MRGEADFAGLCWDPKSATSPHTWMGIMSADRREFLRHATTVVAGLGVGGLPSLPFDEQPGPMPTARAKAMMSTFGLTRPIFQAGMGSVANPALAIAVSNAGALGSI